MSPVLLFVAFAILGVIWTAIWGWVLVSARRPIPYAEVESEAAILRRRLFYLASFLVLIVFAGTAYWLPYPFIRDRVLGRPAVTVHVLAQQWAWTFSRTKVPVGIPVAFDVTSSDVNHGFGLYDPQGHLVAQVQAMPGYTNRLNFTFEQPGTYAVRCLELCGTPHYLMESQIMVTR